MSAREAREQKDRVRSDSWTREASIILSWIEVGATRLQNVRTLHPEWRSGLAPFADDIPFLQAVRDAIAMCETQKIDLQFTGMLNGLVTCQPPQAARSLGLCISTKNRL